MSNPKVYYYLLKDPVHPQGGELYEWINMTKEPYDPEKQWMPTGKCIWGYWKTGLCYNGYYLCDHGHEGRTVEELTEEEVFLKLL